MNSDVAENRWGGGFSPDGIRLFLLMVQDGMTMP